MTPERGGRAPHELSRVGSIQSMLRYYVPVWSFPQKATSLARDVAHKGHLPKFGTSCLNAEGLGGGRGGREEESVIAAQLAL